MVFFYIGFIMLLVILAKPIINMIAGIFSYKSDPVKTMKKWKSSLITLFCVPAPGVVYYLVYTVNHISKSSGNAYRILAGHIVGIIVTVCDPIMIVVGLILSLVVRKLIMGPKYGW